jgi:imidazolonepropionase-like amidohydrolase
MKGLRSGLFLLTALLAPTLLAAGDMAVRAERLYTGTGSVIEDGMVVIEDGRISAVGPAADIRLPQGMEAVRVPVATPGLIDARSTVGLSGAMNQPHDQDQIEHSAAIQPELRAVDAYNPREALVTWLREHGVTTVHAGHGPGEVISGQTLLAKTRGNTIEDAVFRPMAALSASLGEGATAHERKSPGNRSKAVALLRQSLIEADEYREALKGEEAPDRDLALEAMAAVLDGEMPLVIQANRHQDIMTALRLREEFGFRLILAGAADAHLLVDELKAADVPVILHPSMARAWGGSEMANFSFSTAKTLLEAGVPVALQSGHEGYVPKVRVVLFEAGLLLGYGLDSEQALQLITLGPARILGIDDRVGSLEVGKHGDLALFDGDPFEYTTHVIGTVVEGERVSRAVR